MRSLKAIRRAEIITAREVGPNIIVSVWMTDG
jgi:hypothetical protein